MYSIHTHRLLTRVFSITFAVVTLFSMCSMASTVNAIENKHGSIPIIVSLGDSFSSGESIEEFYGQDKDVSEKVNDEDWLAHRSQNSWGGMLRLPSVEGTMADHRNENWYFAAVSGAETKHLKGNQDKTYSKDGPWFTKYEGTYELPPQLDIFQIIPKNETDYVTLTLGGNDAGFTDVVTKAFLSSAYLNISNLSDTLNDTLHELEYGGEIRNNLLQAYEDISEAAGDQAKIIVAGYPHLLDPNGSGKLFTKLEAELVNEAITSFNSAIESFVLLSKQKGIDIYYVPIEDSFAGHEAYTDNAYINGVILNQQDEDLDDHAVTKASAYSMHPNYSGACVYATCVQRKIDELEGLLYSPNVSLSVYGFNETLCNDYKIIIDGKQQNILWGLFSNPYQKEITVTEANPVQLELPKGVYTISVTDGTNTYSKKIKTRSYSDNNTLNFVTNFGYQSKNYSDLTYGQFEKSDLLDDAVMFNGHWYKAIADDSITDWHAAQQYCESMNGYLATITSPEENAFLYQYLIKDCGYENAYIGFTDQNIEGDWQWVTGEDVSYENWHTDEPNGKNSNEDYGMFYYKYTDGTWNDGNFRTGDIFICEWGEYQTSSSASTEPVRETSDERDIVLVLDTSGSMSGNPISEAKNASVNFVSTILKEDASIGVVTYESSSAMVSDFSINEQHLTNAISNIGSGGYTNIEAGLLMAEEMLQSSDAKKKIIVLMSDGEPSAGKEGDDLIAYAETIKNQGIYIYTLGFFESMGNNKASAQTLMERIASDGCHYEVADADSLVFFFGDIADQINGQKYIYVRIACPVDVTVKYDGETLCSVEEKLNTRTAFGSLTFEDNKNESNENSDNRIKILRLREGTDYDIQIEGNGRGYMDYTIGFMDDTGEYSDLRKFSDIKISRRTVIDTVASTSDTTVLNVDEDGDGRYDLKYRATENSRGKLVDYTYIIYIASGVVVSIFILILFIKVKKHLKLKKS